MYIIHTRQFFIFHSIFIHFCVLLHTCIVLLGIFITQFCVDISFTLIYIMHLYILLHHMFLLYIRCIMTLPRSPSIQHSTPTHKVSLLHKGTFLRLFHTLIYIFIYILYTHSLFIYTFLCILFMCCIKSCFSLIRVSPICVVPQGSLESEYSCSL